VSLNPFDIIFLPQSIFPQVKIYSEILSLKENSEEFGKSGFENQTTIYVIGMLLLQFLIIYSAIMLIGGMFAGL